MKRGQSILEFAFLIGVVAAAVTTMLVYINRGFQGNIRSSVEQIGAGQYEPGSIIVNNNESKRVTSNTVSNSITTTIYGSGGNDPQQDNLDAQNSLRSELAALRREIVNQGGNNPLLNQAAIDTGNAIGRISRAGINNATTFTGTDGTVYGLTDAQRAQQLRDFNASRASMNDQLNGRHGLVYAYGALRSEQIKLENTAHRNPTQQSRWEELNGLMAENQRQQTALRTEQGTLNTQRQVLLAGGDITGITIGTITPVVTPGVLPRTLADINADITTKTQELADLIAAYADLPAQSKQGVTSSNTSKNVETGTITIQRNLNEKLDSL